MKRQAALNPEQRSAVVASPGPVVVVATAGAGKTTTLIERIKHLIAMGAEPSRILVVTFSVKAAREMTDRLGVPECRIATFHSVALQIVRAELDEIGSWRIDDTDRYRICIKDAVSFRWMNWQSADVTYLQAFIGRCKAMGASPSDPRALALAGTAYARQRSASREPNLCVQAYETAETVRRERRLLTFDDLLVEADRALESDEGVRMKWASRWEHVLQDEAQDENEVQHSLIGKLARDHRSYTIVGDPAQCHPAGTLVSVSRRSQSTIERLRDGDLVLGWDPATETVVEGCRVSVASRNYDGCYFQVTAAGRTVVTTPNHRFVVRWENSASWALYLLYSRENGYVIGCAPLYPNDALPHFENVVRDGGAERAWVLRCVGTEVDAQAQRDFAAIHFGLRANQNESVSDVNRDDAAGVACLTFFGRDPELPLYPCVHCGGGSFEVYASNIVEKRMRLPLPDAPGEWATVERVLRTPPCETTVYSLQVEPFQTYVADGLVVHNSIYGFRGAAPTALLAFEQEWGARVVRMGRNYRCGTAIVDVANRMLDAMPAHTHLGVRMLAERSEMGEVRVTRYQNFDAEGAGVTAKILESLEDGRAWSDHVVLYRTNAQSRGVEEQLLGARVPYVVLGGTNFYERREVRDLLAYLRLANGSGAYEDIRRSINTPFRFLGRAFLDALDDAIGELDGHALIQGVREHALRATGLQQRQRTSAVAYCQLLESMATKIVEGKRQSTDTRDSPSEISSRPSVLLEHLVRDLRYNEWLTRDEGAESPENNRVSNVRELIRSADRFPTVDGLLTYVDDTLARAAAAKGQAGSGDRVTLCSIHRSKGLEWPVVFVIGVNDKILPHAHAEDPHEERRLAYVACTRAADVLEVSYVAEAAVSNRVMPLEPSPYLIESQLVSGKIKGAKNV